MKGFRFSLTLGTSFIGYKPYINYSWSSTYQESNQIYSKNLGTGTPLALYSGQGAKFNGVDQDIPISEFTLSGDFAIVFNIARNSSTNRTIIGKSNSTFSSIGFKYNVGLAIRIGNTEYEINTAYDTNHHNYIVQRVGSSLTIFDNNNIVETLTVKTDNLVFDIIGRQSTFSFLSGTLKDTLIFNRALTQTEITKYSTNPNGFFNDALVDDTCVLNMPLAENGKYCYDYANYSEGSELLSNNSFIMTLDNWDVFNASSTWNNGVVEITTSAGAQGFYQSFSTEVGKTYIITAESVSASTLHALRVGAGGYPNAGVYTTLETTTPTKHIAIFVATTTVSYVYLRSGEAGTVGWSYATSKQLTGVHEIQSYTDSVRDEARQLPYGSQNANYKINNLGMRTEESPYFECNELFDNYGDTGWIPDIDKDETLEIILDTSKDAIEINGSEFTKGFNVGCYEGTNNDVYIKIHGASTLTPTVSEAINYITVSYNSEARTFNVFINGSLRFVDVSISATENTLLPFTLCQRDGSYQVTTPIRLFKVHQKTLTQEEVIINYNKAVAQGLLT